jgi:glycerol-3-phosphate cytidylyltransferase
MKKYKLGYTSGVFDLFHIGHLNILKRAKKHCEYLIVAVSPDKIVEEYKDKIPVIPLEERMKIVESIKYVDSVVVQASMDKYKAWEKLKFDVLFHGDDWKESSMYNEIEKKLNNVGVDVVYFPITKSTTSTILRNALTIISGNKND